MKFLIVDDSKVMRQIVKKTLREAGFGDAEVVEASDGVEALAQVAATSPDMVLSDWNMPNKTGIEFLTELRASGNATPFGFVTSEGSDGMRARALEAGALFLIVKPFKAEDFEKALAAVRAA
ncbi:MAG: response regulator [Nannocystaceae bacterium]|nr:response regulator [Nannocystaceae bacterium]